MKDQSQTALILPSAPENLLKALDKRTSVYMILDVEVDQVPFHLIADGDSAVISFYSLSDAIALFKAAAETTALANIARSAERCRFRTSVALSAEHSRAGFKIFCVAGFERGMHGRNRCLLLSTPP